MSRKWNLLNYSKTKVLTQTLNPYPKTLTHEKYIYWNSKDIIENSMI